MSGEVGAVLLAIIFLAIAFGLRSLGRMPAVKCGKCGEVSGSNDHCDWCIDDRCAP
jgi:hypothetical protein